MQISRELFITTSKDILLAIGEKQDPPERYCITLGYSSWAAGQLEKEIKEGVWLNSPAHIDIIFENDPAQKWEKALKKIGINDPLTLSGFSGHA
jgi:putative transcriptional regulator